MNTLKKQLAIILFLLLSLSISAAFAAVQPKLSLLQSQMHANDNMMLFAKIDIADQDKIRADLYIRVSLPNGQPYYLNTLTSFTDKPFAILKNWLVSKIPEFKLLSFPLPAAIPEGKYSWEMIFTKPGGNVLNAADILSSSNSDFDFKAVKETTPSKLMAVSTDKSSYSRTDKMRLSIEIDLKDGQSETFDLYISLIDPDGITSSLMPDLSLSKESTRARPILSNFKLSTDVNKIPILELDLSKDSKHGTYIWKLTAVKPGADPGITANIIYEDEIIAEVFDPDSLAFDLNACPPVHSVAACKPENRPKKGGTDPCNYGLNDLEIDTFSRNCNDMLRVCAVEDLPALNLTKCDDSQYMTQGCGSFFDFFCDNLETKVCPGNSRYSCEHAIMSDGKAVQQCQPDFDLEVFTQSCYNNYCSEEPTLEQCLSLEFRMTDYCATGTRASRTSKDRVPGNMTSSAADADENNILIDPVFGAKFTEACEPVITKQVDFCEALRTNKAKLVTNRNPSVTYYTHYIKPFIAYDPEENDSVFYPPEVFALCSVSPEFPTPRTPELLPLYNQSMFVRYGEIVRSNEILSVFDELVRTEDLNPGQFGQGFTDVMTTNRAVVEESMSFGVEQVGVGMERAADLAIGNVAAVGTTLNTSVINGVNLKQVAVLDMYSTAPLTTTFRTTSKRALTTALPDSKLQYTGDFVSLQSSKLQSFKTNISQSINGLNLFTDVQKRHVTDRISMADLADVDNLALDNCNTYSYNKYYSYSILKDKIINATNMLDAVIFAYAPNIAPYSLGLQASQGKGIVRKNGEELEGGNGFAIDYPCYSLFTAKSKRATLATVPTTYTVPTIKDPVVTTTIIKDPVVTIKDPSLTIKDPSLTIKDPVLVDKVVREDPEAGIGLIGVVAVDNPGYDVLSCKYTTHEFAVNGIARSKNFFVDVLNKFTDYSGPILTKDGQNMDFVMTGDKINTVLTNDTLLNTIVNENWTYYKDRLYELPESFVDSGFDGYRDFRIRLLDLLILRARVEKSYAESQGVDFSAAGDDPYKKLTVSADTYVGALSALTSLKTITEDERHIIYGELSKPVYNKNLFYQLNYSAFGTIKDREIAMQVKPSLASSITVPARLTPAKELITKAIVGDIPTVQYVVAGEFYQFAPIEASATLPAFTQSLHKYDPPAITSILNHDSTIAMLDLIDDEINIVLDAVYTAHPECFTMASSACDWLPEQFVERMDDLIPDGMLNESNEQCNVLVGNDGNNRIFNTNSFKFGIDADVLNTLPSHLNSTAEICAALPIKKHSTNTSNVDDRNLCYNLSGSGKNYKSNTVLFEQFYGDQRFFDAVPNAIAAYLLFADNGIDDSRRNTADRKRANTAKELFLGVSYSDFFETGSDWLGLNGGYGIGAGVGNFDSILDGFFTNPKDVNPETDNLDDSNYLKASFFGHAYMVGQLLKLDFDIFRATAFASSSAGFAGHAENTDSEKTFMPGVKSEILLHASKTIGNKKYFSEINVLGYEVYKIAADEVDESPDTKSKRKDWSDSYTLEYNLVTQTIVVIVPIVIEVDAGLGWDYLFHANVPKLRRLVDVTFEPNSSVYVRFAAGVGFDVGFASASAGIEGFLDLLTFEMPLNLNIATEQDNFDIDVGLPNDVQFQAPKITYDNNFSYRITFGSGKIGLYAKVKIGWGWLSYKKSARKTLFDFSDQPLWAREHTIFSMDGEYSLGQIFKGYGLVSEN